MINEAKRQPAVAIARNLVLFKQNVFCAPDEEKKLRRLLNRYIPKRMKPERKPPWRLTHSTITGGKRKR